MEKLKIKLYNKVVDEIADMVWNKHYCLVSDIASDFEEEFYDVNLNTDASEFSKIDFDEIISEISLEIDSLLKRK